MHNRVVWTGIFGEVFMTDNTQYTRREFFSLFARESHVQHAERVAVVGGIEPYAAALTLADVYHVLRRVTLAPTPALAQQLVGKTAGEVVDILLGDGSDTPPEAPGDWVNTTTENPKNADLQTRFAIEAQWERDFEKLQQWWVALMHNEGLPTREKLTLFWSGHLTSEFAFDDQFLPPQLLYRQNQLLRSYRLGNFKELMEEMTLNGAMLMYLGGELNAAGKPNENYARELLELFTTGLGWYTEGDIQEAARVLTGWRIAKFNDEPALNGIYNTYFNAAAHDIDAKQFMGESIAARTADNNTEFLVRRDEVRALINIIFRQRPDAVAAFICRKLYRYFVYSNPSAADEQFIGQLADVFKQNDFAIRPVLAALLKSAHFFDEANRGVQIKTPAECLVGLPRQMGAFSAGANGVMQAVEQTLIDPPNVAGWEGYRTWISTKTYPLRSQFAQGYVAQMQDQMLVNFAKQFADYADVYKLTTALELYFLPKPVLQTRHDNYVKILLQNAPDYEWPDIIATNVAGAALRIRALVSAFIKAPDFHLC